MKLMFDKIKKNTKALFLLLALVVSLPSVAGLMHSGFPLTDDGNWMVIRFTAFYEALRNGQFPVRFLFRLNNGFGYPVADFLYPLFMYIGVPIHVIGFNFVNTIKIIFGLSLVFSSIFSFLWFRKLFDNFSSLVGAIVYVYFPYHLWDVYKRGSIGEALALMILPFILWQIERGSLFWSSIGISFLILSHNTLAILFLFLVILYMFLDIFISKKRNKLMIDYAVILGSGIGMSSFFWIPAIFDLQHTVFSNTKISNWNEYFSNFNLIGWSTIYIIMLTLVFVALRKIDIKKNKLTILILLVGIISIFLATPLSYFIWNLLPVSLIQFPFRLLSVVIVCVSFLSCCIVSVSRGKVKIILAVTILVILFISSKQFIFPSNFQYYPDTYYSTNQDTTTVRNEYMPKWVSETPVRRSEDKVVIINGKGSLSNIVDKKIKVSFNVNLKNSSLIQINTIYFPGWSAFVDKKPQEIIYNNRMGLIQVRVDRGIHSVQAIFSETNLRIISDLISVLSLAFIGLFIFKKKKSI